MRTRSQPRQDEGRPQGVEPSPVHLKGFYGSMDQVLAGNDDPRFGATGSLADVPRSTEGRGARDTQGVAHTVTDSPLSCSPRVEQTQCVEDHEQGNSRVRGDGSPQRRVACERERKEHPLHSE